MSVRTFLVGLLVVLSGPLGADERLSLQVSPEIAIAPAKLTIRARIAPDEENRAVVVTVESEDYYRSSEIQLDGERAPRMTLVNLIDVPAGSYQVSAVLKGPGGRERALAQSTVTIVGESGVTPQ
jgi:hypothetical protein